jgi:transcriptional regulator with XRE-family HTH domain
MTNGNDLGKIIKQRRTAIPLTLRDLAALSGVSGAYLSRIERGERFPSAHILQRIAKPLGFKEDELFTHARFLSHKSYTAESENATKRADHVAKVLAQEPVEMQDAVLGIISILKLVSKAARTAELPELQEYMQQKYPFLDEDLITMIEDLIARKAN